jgi:2-amino-4-hydroxy-6-hydroxymethyldihydropteridine diphosphokinase
VILIGIGANLASESHGAPVRTCEAALRALAEVGVRVLRRSRWYRSRPVPPSDQAWYVNGVAAVETDLGPNDLLALLHALEARFGRRRPAPRDAARVLDLDLLDHDGLVTGADAPVRLPHPRLHARAFVLKPLAEVAPGWRHPLSGLAVEALIGALPADQVAEPLEEH